MVQYGYDAASNRVSMTDPQGAQTSYAYDNLNRLTSLSNSWAGTFGFSYDALSRRTQLTRPNGVNTNYSYDNLSHLLSVLHQAGGTTLDGATYTYDAAGNRLSKNDLYANVTSNYAYDAIYQLLQVTQGTSTTESYTYDIVGNRLSSLGLSTYQYNSSNELTSTALGSYTYDHNGNTLIDAQGRSYSWDYENRLTQVVNPGVGTTTFKYDPFGRRIYKQSPSFTGAFIYDGRNLIETLNSSGAVIADYAQTQKIDEPLAELRSDGSSYYEADGLGSLTSLTNSTGTLANTYTYDSFGNVTNSTGTLRNPFQYSGREFDQDTGLDYYRARYYDPTLGRFLSEDPIRFDGGANFYAYVDNDPTVLVDPLGLQHTPGGPWHPPDGIQFSCDWGDDCSTLSWKIDIFKRVIASHTAWDAANKTNRHAGEIADFKRGLDNCIEIHQQKCTNCPNSQPAPQPVPLLPILPIIEEILEGLALL
jgi:RHS repeat-associated protein